MAGDPEAMHARLTSGSPSTVVGLAQDLAAASRATDGAANHVVEGLNGTRWAGGLAQISYELAGRGAFIASAVASWRLQRAHAVLELVATSYADTIAWADRVIRVWRRDPVRGDQLRGNVLLALAVLSFRHDGVLDAARESLTTIDDDLEDWLRDGASDDYWLYLRTGGERGPRIPDGVINGDDGGWTPQGLAYDPVTGTFLTTSYRDHVGDPDDPEDDYDDSRLSVIDQETGEVLGQVRLTGPDGTGAPTHSGGVAVNGDRVYVVGGGVLYEYSMADIRRAGRDGTVPAGSTTDVDSSSYVTVANGRLWLGNWGDSTLTSYPLTGPGGSPDYSRPQTYDTPDGTNGVAVLPDGRLVFAVNHGRDEPGSLDVYRPEEGGLTRSGSVPVGNLPEELVVVDGRLVATSEAGADDYAPWDLDGRDGEGDDGVNDTGGSEGVDDDDFWGQTHLLAIPLEALSRDDGWYVEPLSLRQASRELFAAADALGAVTTSVEPLHLPSSAVGQVDGAGPLSRALGSYLDGTAAELSASGRRSERIGVALRDTAGDYDASDLSVAERLAWYLHLTRH